MTQELPVIHSPAKNAGRWCDRTLCGALDDMRTVLKAHDTMFAEWEKAEEGIPTILKANSLVLNSLLEEIQVYASRMESALTERKSETKSREEYKELLLTIDKLKKQKTSLKKSIEKQKEKLINANLKA